MRLSAASSTPSGARLQGRLALLLAGASLLLAACAAPGDSAGPLPVAPEAASGWTDKPGWIAHSFMVAAANPLATQAGYDILKAGGSAIDAAIATQMVLNLVEPNSSGIGGGAFLLHSDGKQVLAYDGRETAPAAADERLFLGPDGKALPFRQALVGGRSVGVPGVLRMLELAHRQHGRLPWARLFEPAIRLAQQGFAISPRLAAVLAEDPDLASDPAARAYFYLPDGKPKPAGTVLRNPEFAAVLREVAAGGADAFYRGQIARDIEAKVRAHPTNPGRLRASDLAAYQARVREPICTDYRRWTVCGMPPPSSGGIAIAQMLGMLAAMPATDIARATPAERDGRLEPSVQGAHLFSEVGRLAYADRARYVADTDFVPLPGGSWRSLVDPAYLAKRAAAIGERSIGVAQPGTPAGVTLAMADDRSPELPSTSHLSVVDRYGNAISMTTSIEHQFGSRQMVRGFLLNNQLTDFSFVAEENGQPVANRVQPGKRPRSSMAPTLVFERGTRELVMTLGSPGGSAIINYVGKALVGTLDWKLDLQQAIALPNVGSRNGPTELEQGRVSEALVQGLKARGHDIRLMEQTSGLQGIMRVTVDGRPAWFGGADPRREGVAMGE
ncbi:gamma-glutamyltransferase [Cupriavidus sp. AU9028]|uniref:gamma-glutamyltransferase n=1 Tax=Cupriavidus sp. AU9028 TaxID=2871157 RepID=UPI002107E50F|nr:gamma-glutamyltransferase [Cupriavidus sp. AU9028]